MLEIYEISSTKFISSPVYKLIFCRSCVYEDASENRLAHGGCSISLPNIVLSFSIGPLHYERLTQFFAENKIINILNETVKIKLICTL